MTLCCRHCSCRHCSCSADGCSADAVGTCKQWHVSHSCQVRAYSVVLLTSWVCGGVNTPTFVPNRTRVQHKPQRKWPLKKSHRPSCSREDLCCVLHSCALMLVVLCCVRTCVCEPTLKASQVLWEALWGGASMLWQTAAFFLRCLVVSLLCAAVCSCVQLEGQRRHSWYRYCCKWVSEFNINF